MNFGRTEARGQPRLWHGMGSARKRKATLSGIRPGVKLRTLFEEREKVQNPVRNGPFGTVKVPEERKGGCMQDGYTTPPTANSGAVPRVAFLGSYPPRECGIGTFTYDLVGAYDSIDPSRLSAVIAVNDYGQVYDYDLHDYQGRVRYQIDSEDLDTYLQVADEINKTRVQVVNVQHEYGLYGGEHGEYIVDFIERLEKPVVVTLHTVLPHPEGRFREVTQKLLDRASAVVVLAST
jgi:hypothetical protein